MKRGRHRGGGSSPPSSRSPAALVSRGPLARSAATSGSGAACLQLVGESLCEAADLRPGEGVLVVDAVTGDLSLSAARRFAEVIATTDGAPEVLEERLRGARSEGLSLEVRTAGCATLPFADGAFDVALRADGAAFSPQPRRAAAELLRVVRRGGRIGLACWAPDGFVGQLLAVIESFAPRADDPRPSWGSETRLVELFGPRAADLRTRRAQHVFRYRSPEHWIAVFAGLDGAVQRVFAALDAQGREALREDLVAVLEAWNRGGREALVVPADYLETVVTK